jgi:Fe-S cluster biosynthesis and repair protein YggX
MSKTVYCAKLKQEAPGLDIAPYPGELGARVFNEISAKAWEMWQSHQTILINEYRLNLSEKEARNFLKQQMIEFLFNDNAQMPDQYTAPE